MMMDSHERALRLFERINGSMNKTHLTDDRKPRLPNSPQPPPVIPWGDPGSDRAKKLRLVEPSATDSELSPGDRSEGLRNFGIPAGQLGTVEQANDEDAVEKWDDGGRMRLHQPWLKKV
jgi:hypothetical protein